MSELSDASDYATKLEEAEREAALEQHKTRKRNASTFCLTPECGVKLPSQRYEFGYCIDCASEMELKDRIRGYR